MMALCLVLIASFAMAGDEVVAQTGAFSFRDYMSVENIASLFGFVWGALLYFLPPEKAQKLNLIGNVLKTIVNTPAGIAFKKDDRTSKQTD